MVSVPVLATPKLPVPACIAVLMPLKVTLLNNVPAVELSVSVWFEPEKKTALVLTGFAVKVPLLLVKVPLKITLALAAVPQFSVPPSLRYVPVQVIVPLEAVKLPPEKCILPAVKVPAPPVIRPLAGVNAFVVIIAAPCVTFDVFVQVPATFTVG